MSKRLPNSPDSNPGRWSRTSRYLRRLTGFTLALLPLLALLHLVLLGVPQRLTRRITRTFQDRGIPVSIGSIRLSPHRGWVLREVRLYSPFADDLEPVLHAKKLYVLAWPDHWLAPFSDGWNVKTRGRQIGVSPGTPWNSGMKQRFGTVETAKAAWIVAPGTLTLTRSDLTWAGCNFHVTGGITFAKNQAPLDAGRCRIMRTKALLIADALTGLQFDEPPEISIRFNVPLKPEPISLSAALDAEGFRRNGLRINRLSAAASISNRVLRIDPFVLEQHDSEQLSLDFSLAMTNQSAECTIHSSLQPADLLSLLPENTANGLKRAEISLPGDCVFDARFGPAPLPNLFSELTLQVQNAEAVRKDISLTNLRARVIRSGDQLEIRDIQTEANGGPLEGSASADLAARTWTTTLSGTVQPAPIGTLLGEGAAAWINRFAFTNRPPQIRVTLFSGPAGHSLQMTGHLAGEQFTCAGLPFDTIEMGMAYSNRVFTLAPLHLTRGDREFTGTVATDFRSGQSRFEATSEFSPADVGQVLVPDHPTILSRFSFDGPVQSKAAGRVDYRGGTNHAFSGQLDAENVSMDSIRAESFSSRIDGLGTQLIFTNSTVQLFGGRAEGSAVFNLHTDDNTIPYRMECEAADMDLPQILQVIDSNSTSRTTGRLSGRFNFTADGKDGFWKTAQGSGAVEIIDGRLAELPILGELSRIIRTTLPAFSLFSLTTLYSEFDMTAGELHTDDLELGGTLLTILSSGTYSPAKGLDFSLQVEPFRQTRSDKEWYHIHLWSADVIKQGTAPLFKLLKLHLGGSLEKPEWNMINFPTKSIPGIGNQE